MDLAGAEYKANQDVIIYSQSHGGWVPARIESCNADDSVTVKYSTGHTKLVPLEFQSTHLKPADEPPPEPTMIQVKPPEDLFSAIIVATNTFTVRIQGGKSWVTVCRWPACQCVLGKQ